MKRIFSVLLSLLLLLSLFPVTAFAAEENDISKFELPAPQAPNYFVYTNGDETEARHDDLRMIMLADPEVALLAAEHDRDSDAFYEKYGLYSFEISMQYDVSLDGEDNWQHNAEWDTNWNTGGYADGYPYVCLRSEMMEDFEFFWLTYYEGEGSDTFTPFQSAITTYVYHHEDWDENIYSFDVKNHSLYIRCRYYMEWEPVVMGEYGEGPGEKQSKVSAWSESAVFGKNSTQIIPDEPTVYEAPVISNLKIVLSEGDENSHIEYAQTTPESVWMNGVYYEMTGEGEFEGLETQVSIDGGGWIEFDTADAGGDWCLWNGNRSTYNYDVPIEENTNVKLRIRFTGTHGPSEWSNVLETNGIHRFQDVDSTHWAYPGMKYAVDTGLMNGTGTGVTFEPNLNMSRAMLVTVLWRYNGAPEAPDCSFKDVAKSDWFYNAVAWAASEGVVNGVGDGSKFDPNGDVTREMLATILYRYAGKRGVDVSATASISDYPDANKVASWSSDAVKWAVAEGIISGAVKDGKTVLAPQDSANRAVVATIMMRFIENVLES